MLACQNAAVALANNSKYEADASAYARQLSACDPIVAAKAETCLKEGGSLDILQDCPDAATAKKVLDNDCGTIAEGQACDFISSLTIGKCTISTTLPTCVPSACSSKDKDQIVLLATNQCNAFNGKTIPIFGLNLTITSCSLQLSCGAALKSWEIGLIAGGGGVLVMALAVFCYCKRKKRNVNLQDYNSFS